MTYTEDDLLPLSALSQYFYCPRRAGLLLIEQRWLDNVHTVEGSIIHERVHQAGKESRSEIIRLRSLPLHSLIHGLSGMADSVELYANCNGFPLKGLNGLWEIVPVEYKHGKVREEEEYEVQLCAQAICIEEMLNCTVQKGYVFYARDHRRKEVLFTTELRQLVAEGAKKLHEMLRVGNIPHAKKSRKCQECSMQDECLPKVKMSAARYLEELWADAEKSDVY